MNFDADIRSLVQAYSSKEGLAETVAESTRQEGAFKGQSAVVVDEQTALADSAEEMTYAASEKVEKTLSERKAGSKEALRLSAAELAERYVNMMSNSQQGSKLHKFLDDLKNMGGKATEEQIREKARQFSGDTTDQYAALEFVEKSLEMEGGQEELLGKVRAAKESLMKEAGPAIRAGINIATDVLSAAKKGLGQVGSLRELYQFAILGRATVHDMYQAIMKRYGETQFQHALEFLLQAAGNDLASQTLGPSMESIHLRTAIDDITHVQYLGNLYRSLSELVDRVRPAPAYGG